MKDITNYSKIKSIIKTNGGYITREDIDKANIPSWFLSDFVKKNKLIKVAPGFYASESYIPDVYFILQRRFQKYIFSGVSALYLHKLTDRTPDFIDVTAPQGYNPTRNRIDSLIIHKISNENLYKLGITEAETMFGNTVKVYDEERTICDLIKNRNKYDSELFIKAIRSYIKKINNQSKLFKYARILGVENKVFEVMEVVVNSV
jgi:predicted transcriptional regulator of viral defense system